MDLLKPRVLLSTCADSEFEYKNDILKSAYVQKMKKYVDFVSFCPEERVLQGHEKEELRIIRKTTDTHKILGVKSKYDYTEEIKNLAKELKSEYNDHTIDGFLFKSKRTLTGVNKTKVYRNVEKKTIVTSHHKGALTKEVQRLYPLHVISTERMLRDEFDRDMFLVNIFTRARFRVCNTFDDLLKFHNNNQYLLMIFNQSAYRRMGQILRNPAKYRFDKLKKQYEEELFKALQKYVSIKRSAKMIEQLYDHFKKDLKIRERIHFNDLLKKYKEEKVPLSMLLELMKSYVIRFENDFLLSQTIFEPFPWELNRY